MSPTDISGRVETARDLTIQSQIRDDPTENLGLVFWLGKAGHYLSPWWSPMRDGELREFWKKTDYLSGAVFTMTAKMTAIPFKIVARNTAVREHQVQAEKMTEILSGATQFGEGWNTFYSRFVEDLITQDNGAFAEIIGPGRVDGPLTGRPTSVSHLDAAHCQRTGNPEFPVVYRDFDGKPYKLHYTRVMYASQMTSPIAEMYGVGFSSVSRCVNVSQTLLDILLYKQEKLGSRPHRAIIITKGGLDPQDLSTAFQLAESEMDGQGLSRYSKIVVAGSSSIEDASHELIELSSLPDGFNEESSVTLGMATIALAFGVDPRELFPGLTVGSTRAEALLQHLKQRGKGPGQILDITERLFNHKVLPPHLMMQFNFQDDAQDRQVADIRKVRAERRNLDMNSGSITTRVVREQMMGDGEITKAEFTEMELQDGRVDDGIDVVDLFYKKNDPLTKKYLNLGVEDPINFYNVDPKQVLPKVVENLQKAKADLLNKYGDTTDEDRINMLSVVAALTHLKQIYLSIIEMGATEPEDMMSIAESTHAGLAEGAQLGGSAKKTPFSPLGPNGAVDPQGNNGKAPTGRDVRRQGGTANPDSATNPREVQRGRLIPDKPVSEVGE